MARRLDHEKVNFASKGKSSFRSIVAERVNYRELFSILQSENYQRYLKRSRKEVSHANTVCA